jgi:hypothetical protein
LTANKRGKCQPYGQAPDLCNDQGFVHNKCAKDAEGYAACAMHIGGDGLTGCEAQNEWPYYKCVCPKGTNKAGLHKLKKCTR